MTFARLAKGQLHRIDGCEGREIHRGLANALVVSKAVCICPKCWSQHEFKQEMRKGVIYRG